MLRLVEDHRLDAEGPSPWAVQGGVGVHVCGGRLQLGADAEPEDELSWCRMSQRSTVSVLAKNERKIAYLQTLTTLRVDSIKLGWWSFSRTAVFPKPARLVGAQKTG